MTDIRGQRTEDGGRQSNFTAGGNFPTNLNEFHECSRTRTLRRVFARESTRTCANSEDNKETGVRDVQRTPAPPLLFSISPSREFSG